MWHPCIPDVFECPKAIRQGTGFVPVERTKTAREYRFRRITKVCFGIGVCAQKTEFLERGAAGIESPFPRMETQVDDRAPLMDQTARFATRFSRSDRIEHKVPGIPGQGLGPGGNDPEFRDVLEE